MVYDYQQDLGVFPLQSSTSHDIMNKPPFNWQSVIVKPKHKSLIVDVKWDEYC